MAPLQGLAIPGRLRVELLAHGGVGGAIVESLVVLTIVALFAAVWLRERRRGGRGGGD